MTHIPKTLYFDSVVLDETRRNGIKHGADWMRNKIIEILNGSEFFDWHDKQLIEQIKKIDTADCKVF